MGLVMIRYDNGIVDDEAKSVELCMNDDADVEFRVRAPAGESLKTERSTLR